LKGVGIASVKDGGWEDDVVAHPVMKTPANKNKDRMIIEGLFRPNSYSATCRD
jgi:hypothetical protein